MKRYLQLFCLCFIAIILFIVSFVRPVEGQTYAYTILQLFGATSGNVTLQASSTAGTPTITFGTSSGTPAVTASAPYVINSTTGNLTGPAAQLFTSAPAWLRYFGDGSDGAITVSSPTHTFAGITYATTFTCSSTADMTNQHNPIIILATTSITLNAGCVVSSSPNTNAGNGGNDVKGDIGGSGGGSGGGAAAGTLGNASNVIGGNSGGGTLVIAASGGTAGASSGGNGGNGNPAGGNNFVNATSFIRGVLIAPPVTAAAFNGGGAGTAGGSSGGAAGRGAEVLILAAPTITIASGVLFDASGASGACAAANSTGAGSGGGGGVVLLAAQTLTDNGATYNVIGGHGGCTANPEVFLCVPGIVTTKGTCPGSLPVGTPTQTTQGAAHVSTFSGGNPTVITVDAAGSGYNYTPGCMILGTGGGANTGSGATCTVTVTANAIASIAVTGGNAGYGTGTTYTTAGLGGYGGNGWQKGLTIQ